MDRKTLRQAKLRELAGFQICGGFEDNLYRLTRIAGELLAAGRVSLMLLDSGHGKGSRLKLSALYGELPEAAWKEEQAPGQGVAGRVLASGVSARVNRIGRSAWKSTARRPDDAGAFMACPLFLAGEPAGVLNISNPVDREIFSADDLAAAELAALLIARAIQVGRLERMLDSRPRPGQGGENAGQGLLQGIAPLRLHPQPDHPRGGGNHLGVDRQPEPARQADGAGTLRHPECLPPFTQGETPSVRNDIPPPA